MTISETLGSPALPSIEPIEYLTLAFSPLSAPLRSRWRNNGLSADFLSDYVTTFLPRKVDAGTGPDTHRSEIRHAVSYVANELLENAMKYHEPQAAAPIQIYLELAADHVTITATNGVTGAQGDLYKGFVRRLLEGDPSEMMMQQLEAGGSGPATAASGLGLLTMINDYGAELGWRFDEEAGETGNLSVTTTVMLPLKNLPGGVAV